MGLIDRMMRAWASGLRRLDACAWCHDRPRSPSTDGGLFCSEKCAQHAGESQALGF